MNRDMLTQENAENVTKFGQGGKILWGGVPVAEIEHREDNYARIVRRMDVSQLPHGTKLYAMEIPAMNCVRAKVRCNAKTTNTVDFTTVYETDETKAADPENVRFTKATPWGDIRLGIDNPEAIAFFEINKEYYVDFTVAAKS